MRAFMLRYEIWMGCVINQEDWPGRFRATHHAGNQPARSLRGGRYPIRSRSVKRSAVGEGSVVSSLLTAPARELK